MQVVIIDDNAINLSLLGFLVQALEGATSIPFANPLNALDWCYHQEADLVIVDYMMPQLNGLEFIRAFRQLPGRDTVPVLMVTADHRQQIRHEALQLGCNDFLTKPLDRIEFLARSRNMLALRSHQKSLANRAQTLAQEVRKATATLQEREREAILRLSRAAEYRDPETGAHLIRMANCAQIIAGRLGLSLEEQLLLRDAAPMHDIGKVGIPDHILLKPGRLTPEEMTLMREHSQIGYDILKDSANPLMQAAAQIALGHHEKFDGSGYPQQLAGEAIPLFARIVAVADVFDALTSPRPYKPAWTLVQALDYMRSQRGLHFDPAILDAFLADVDSILTLNAELPGSD